MKLLRIRLVGLGPFDDLTCNFAAQEVEPRPATLVFGSGGVGKTTLLSAIASTRPGHAVAITEGPGLRPRGFAVADWMLGDDDPERPHPLCVASPNASVSADDDVERMRRREQTLFERRTSEAGGFVLLGFSATRWFSNTPLHLTTPTRSVLRYDPRAAIAFDDAGRSELGRDTKQALAYTCIAAALPELGTLHAMPALAVLHEAMRDVVQRFVALAGVRFVGVDPLTLEPVFERGRGEHLSFDNLPTSVRHLVALAALTVRTLAAAYPGRDPRMTEGVVLVDEASLYQDPRVLRQLIPTLRGALPRVQWILTSSASELTLSCDSSEILALRRLPNTRRVELFEGQQATLH